MRLSRVVVAIAVTVLGLSGLASAETSRTLEGRLDATGEIGVENLAGEMRVVATQGAQLTVRATVHAESEELAAGVRLEKVKHEGRQMLRVRYPDGVRDVRYPKVGGGHTRTTYDGERYRVSGRKGELVYVDVEVGVPVGADAKLQTHVGRISAAGVSGKLRFDTGSGNIDVESVSGDIRADTGSGDVSIEGARGKVSCDTGSGECDVRGVEGERLDCDTGSGNIRVVDARVEQLKADTGSGNIRLEAVDAQKVVADTGSGNIELGSSGSRLSSIEADTGSGDVRLGLPADSGFEARFDLGSGDADCHFDDAEPILRRREVVGYRRGDGRIRIEVDSGSGDVVLRASGDR